MDALKQAKLAGRGGGRGSRGRGNGRGVKTGPSGRGRAKGRGRGSKLPGDNLDITEDDELCVSALVQAELENDSIAKSFEELNTNSTLDGFDEMSGDMWVYPTNRPVRDYQFQMVNTALFHNTLVTLPTGLGKTFISAVIMYNFQRWYPNGIIVFMAPTRPLVKQQLAACHTSVGIPPYKTAELTGSLLPAKREKLWQSKTVFFLTPQVMLSDLERKFFSPEKVRCVVVDEAHKALGNHAYVQVISKIVEKNRLFRVLALSATPGSDIPSVQQVLKNLLISRVELRSEDSPDILPYTHTKDREKYVVKVEGYLKEVHVKISQIFQIFAGNLMKAGALTGRAGSSFAKFQLLKARESFRVNLAPRLSNNEKKYIERDFHICISLAHAIELLLSHGLRTWYSFLQGALQNGNPWVCAELKKIDELQSLLLEVQEKLNISVENSTFDFTFDLSHNMGDLTTSKTDESPIRAGTFMRKSFSNNDDVDYTLSHPKLVKLKEIVQQHFEEFHRRNENTRVMIFSQYRDSVQEIGNMLSSLRPLVKPMIFVGKANAGISGKGLKQKEQINIMQQFREGSFNTLISTAVGEEGLDIGEVDLIICFDVSKSPTRMIQRMGRTGRQRDGRTVFLITEGKEERSYSASFCLHSSISKNITDPKRLEPFMYKQSPRMVPAGIEPTCLKMSIILSTEQKSHPDALDSDIECLEDEFLGGEAKKDRNTAVKKTNTKTRNTKAKSSKQAEQNVKPKNTIADMFARAKKPEALGKSEVDKSSGTRSPLRTVNLDTRPAPYASFSDMCIDDDDIRMLVVNQHESLYKNSVVMEILQPLNQDKNSWKPCTSFAKEKSPPSVGAISDLINSGFTVDNLVLGEGSLAKLESSLNNRRLFSYPKSQYCGCGNTFEELHKYKCDGDKAFIDDSSSTDYSEPESAPEPKQILERPKSQLPTSNFNIVNKFKFNSSKPKPTQVQVGSTVKLNEPINKSREATNTFSDSSKTVSSKCDVKPKLTAVVDTPKPTPALNVCAVPPVKDTVAEREESSFSEDEFPLSPDIKTNRVYEQCKEFKAQRLRQSQQTAAVKSLAPSLAAAKSLAPSLAAAKSLAPSLAAPKSLAPSLVAAKSVAPSLAAAKSLAPTLVAAKSVAPSLAAAKSLAPSLAAAKSVAPSLAAAKSPVAILTSAKSPAPNVPPKLSTRPSSTPFSLNKRIPFDSSDSDDDDFINFITGPKATPTPNKQKTEKVVTTKAQQQKQTTSSNSRLNVSSTSVSRWLNKSNYNCGDSSDDDDFIPHKNKIFNLPKSDKKRTPTSSKKNERLKASVSPPASNRCSTPQSSGRRSLPRFRVDCVDLDDDDDFKPSAKKLFSPPPTSKNSSNLLDKSNCKPTTTVTIDDESGESDTSEKLSPIIGFRRPAARPIANKVKSSREVSFEESKVNSSANSTLEKSVKSSSHTPSPSVSNLSRLDHSSNSISCLDISFQERKKYYSPEREKSKVKKFKFKSRNPFLNTQAGVDDEDGASDDEEDADAVDLDDSFVTHDESISVTASQHAMYVRSLMDVPVLNRRPDPILSPKHYGSTMDDTADDYDRDDSFCQEEVEFTELGVFTQAMNQAKIDLEKSPGLSGLKTRRRKRLENATASGLNTASTKSQTKKRRRVVLLEDDDSD